MFACMLWFTVQLRKHNITVVKYLAQYIYIYSTLIDYVCILKSIRVMVLRLGLHCILVILL